MKGLKQHELNVVAQKERVAKLESAVVAKISTLAPGEQLVIAIPAVLGKWEDSIPIVVGPGMESDFRSWLSEAEQHIQGPVYNLPALTAGFMCIVIDGDFDPRGQQPPTDASIELLGALTSLGKFLDSYESKAA